MCLVLQLVVPDRNRKGEKGRKTCETNEELRREGEMGIEGKGGSRTKCAIFSSSFRCESIVLSVE